jgi:hypothetical protein
MPMHQMLKTSLEKAEKAVSIIKKQEKILSDSLKTIESKREIVVTILTNDIIYTNPKPIGTLHKLINGKMSEKHYHGKNLYRDFLYLYNDSTNRQRLIHPMTFAGYKINNKESWEENGDDDFEEHLEQNLSKNYEKLNAEEKNWSMKFELASSAVSLRKLDALIVNSFKYFDTGRSVNYSMKLNRVKMFPIDKESDTYEIVQTISNIDKFLSRKE